MIFNFVISILLLLQYSKGLLQNYTFPKLNLTRKEFDLIEMWLKEPLKDLPHLHLKLTVDNFQMDIENVYTQWFMQQTQLPIILSTYEHLIVPIPVMDLKANTTSDNYVIVTTMERLRMASRQFVQRAGVFFFIIDDAIDMKELRDIFHKMWNRFLVFKNFLLTTEGIFIYDPFALNETGDYGKIIRYQGLYSMERTLFNNMRGYPMRVQIFESVYAHLEFDSVTKKVKLAKGVDGRVANLMEKQLNFTMILQDPDPNYFGERLPNGSYNGAIGSIINNQVDIALNGFFVKDYLTTEIEFSVAVYEDQLCIYTPKAQRIPNSVLPIYSVDYKIWLCFIFIGFASSCIWILFRRLNLRLNIIDRQYVFRHMHNHHFAWQCLYILNDTVVAWVRSELVRYPPFSSERVFVITVSLASVIFGAIFDSSLATVYISPLFFKDINSLEELVSSGLSIHYKYASWGDDLFFSETSTLFASLNKKLVFIENYRFDVFADVAFNGGKAGVTRYSVLIMDAVDLVVSKHIWMIPECPKYYTISYVWSRDAPWEETFNQELLTYISIGLIEKFMRDMKIDVDIRIMTERLYETYSSFRVLTLEDLQLSFYIVFIGSILAVTCFIVEKLCPPNNLKIK